MFGKKSDEPVNNFSRYTDPTGQLPNRELEAAGWYLRHQLLLEHIAIGALITFCAITVGYAVIGWGFYFASGYWQDLQMATELRRSFENYDVLKASYAARPLDVLESTTLPSASGRFDFISIVKNSNASHMAKVTFAYTVDGQTTDDAVDVLMPGEERPIGVLGYASVDTPGSVQLIIRSVEWRRVNPHTVPSAIAYVSERRQFLADNIRYVSEQQDGGVLTFDLTNQSPYSYWQAAFYVVLKDNGSTSGVLYVTVDKLKANEKRTVTVRVLTPNVPVTGIELFSVNNVFDSGQFVLPGA